MTIHHDLLHCPGCDYYGFKSKGQRFYKCYERMCDVTLFRFDENNEPQVVIYAEPRIPTPEDLRFRENPNKEEE